MGEKRLILEDQKKRQVPLRRMARGVGGSLAGGPDRFRFPSGVAAPTPRR